MFENDRYPLHAQSDLAFNEETIVAGYLAAMKEALHESGLFTPDAVDAVVLKVARFDPLKEDDKIRIPARNRYISAGHIYEFSAVTDADCARVFDGRPPRFADIKTPVAALSEDAQKIILCQLLVADTGAKIETLAARFGLAVNAQMPATSMPAISMDKPFSVSVATARTLDEFFTVAVEALKHNISRIQDKQARFTAVKKQPPAPGR